MRLRWGIANQNLLGAELQAVAGAMAASAIGELPMEEQPRATPRIALPVLRTCRVGDNWVTKAK